MQIETQRLEDRITKSEICALQHKRMPVLSVYDTCKLKYQETVNSRLLEEELKRRENSQRKRDVK